MDIQMITKRFDFLSRRICKTSALVLFTAGALLAFVSSFRGPQYYANWGYEQSLFTFGSSMQYFTAGLAAFICYSIAKHHKKAGTKRTTWPWLWLFAALGFVCAAADETLSFHEHMMRPFREANPWMNHLYIGDTRADDIFVLSLGVSALLFTAFFIRELKAVPKARFFYFAGLSLLLLAGSIDYFPEHIVQNRFPLGTEELAEYFAGTSFCVSFIVYFVEQSKVALQRMIMSLDSVREPRDEVKVEVLSDYIRQ